MSYQRRVVVMVLAAACAMVLSGGGTPVLATTCWEQHDWCILSCGACGVCRDCVRGCNHEYFKCVNDGQAFQVGGTENETLLAGLGVEVDPDGEVALLVLADSGTRNTGGEFLLAATESVGCYFVGEGDGHVYYFCPENGTDGDYECRPCAEKVCECESVRPPRY